MLEELKQAVCAANLLLPVYKLVSFTWGNVSGIDRASGLVVIKPSGVEYDKMTIADMVVVDMSSGEVVEGSLRPSADLPTHLELYRSFPDIQGVVHTHSRWATIYAQAQRSIPVLGTTHADYFYGDIPVTGLLSSEEIAQDYERATGKVIVASFKDKSPNEIPAVLIAGHGPFTWGSSPLEAVHRAVVLEEVAFMAWHTELMSEELTPFQEELLAKHFLRKHGAKAYYGQQ